MKKKPSSANTLKKYQASKSLIEQSKGYRMMFPEVGTGRVEQSISPIDFIGAGTFRAPINALSKSSKAVSKLKPTGKVTLGKNYPPKIFPPDKADLKSIAADPVFKNKLYDRVPSGAIRNPNVVKTPSVHAEAYSKFPIMREAKHAQHPDVLLHKTPGSSRYGTSDITYGLSRGNHDMGAGLPLRYNQKGGYLPMYQSSNRSLIEQSAGYQGMIDALRAEEGDITGTGMVEQSISPFDFIGPGTAGNVGKMFTGSPSPFLMAGMKGAGKKGITHKGIKGVVKKPKPPTKAEKAASEEALNKFLSQGGTYSKVGKSEEFIPKYDPNVIKMFEKLAAKEAGNLKKGGHLPMYQISKVNLPGVPKGFDTRIQPGSYDVNTGKMGYRSTPQQSWDNPDALNMGDVPMHNPNPNVSSVPNMFMGYGQMPTYQKGGGLSRVKNYGSSSNPYPSVSPGDFAGGGRSYPIPTRADAVDALRLAGLHGRSDVKSKVYAKYPGLKKKKHGGNIHPNAIAEVEAGEVIEEVPGNPTRVLEYGESVRNSQNYQKMTGNKHSDPEGGPQIAGAEGGFVYSDFLKVPKDIEETLKYLV